MWSQGSARTLLHVFAESRTQVLLHVRVERLPPVVGHVRPDHASVHEELDRREVLDLLSLRDLCHLVDVDAHHLEKADAKESGRVQTTKGD